ncbi:Leo1-like protein-domain-containing protein [Schizophyllum amplum]|uniref:Leo1-like protein-domain-containing protein n=1 Tax=Schizophyllum amplum TaxID=97359 RepID=A0A550CKI7_9AGAR|nr:Leo1-like protein-domain-containing protein [Auriculariopsis ampla]
MQDQDVDMNAFAPKEEEQPELEQEQADEGDAEDLFGEDEDVATPSAGSDRLPTLEQQRRRELEYTENDEPPFVAPLKEASVSLPNLPLPEARMDQSTWVVRPENEMAPTAASMREQSLSIKLKVENTIRWRWGKEQPGEDVRQSNSRIIRWSDGSLSLRLGKELFDIQQTVDNSATMTRQTMGGAGSQRPHKRLPSPTGEPRASPILSRSTNIPRFFRARRPSRLHVPHAVRHAFGEPPLLVSAVSQKRNKSARVRMAPDPTVDPEREKAELIRQDMKKTKRTRSEPRPRRSRRTDDMWSDDDEEEGYAYDEEEGGGRRGSTSKKAGRSRDEASGGGEYQEDDFVVADEDESEEEPSTKRRRHQEDEDALDRAERELEKRNRDEKKSGGRSSPKEESDDGEEAMDVESEEEEDRVRIRRADSRRRVHVEEEEEE